MSQTSNSPKRV